ncbi:MAG: CBS domain-containing protein [Halanaerobiales bacterium]
MFKKSITIFKISGIPIKLHISFLLILPFLAWAFGNNLRMLTQLTGVPYGELTYNPYSLGFLLAVFLFISVAMHELAHSFVARSQGIEINDITLMLFGGLAQMEEISEEPKNEAWMAFSGPLFSLVLGFILVNLASILSDQLIPDFYLLIIYLGQLNIFLGFFNLLPAFPSDGGRILRAFIARKRSFLEATRIAASVGKAFAFLFGIIGLVSGNFILLFIALFIFIGASQEYQTNLLKDTLSDFKVKDLMTERVSTINQNLNIEALLDKMFEERHSGYPVVDENGNLKGCVTMEDVQPVSTKKYSTTRIKDIMSTDIKKVSPEDSLFEALKKISKADIGRLMVMEEDKLIGIITRSDIMKGYRLKQMQKKEDRD